MDPIQEMMFTQERRGEAVDIMIVQQQSFWHADVRHPAGNSPLSTQFPSSKCPDHSAVGATITKSASALSLDST